MRPRPSRRPRHRKVGGARLGTAGRRTVVIARGTVLIGLAAVLATGLDRVAAPAPAAAAPGPVAAPSTGVAAASSAPRDPARSVAAETARWTGVARADAAREVRESRALAAAALAAATGLDPVRIAPQPPPALADLDDAVAELRTATAVLPPASGATDGAEAPAVPAVPAAPADPLDPDALDLDVRTVAGPVEERPPATALRPDGARSAAAVVARTVPARLAAAADVRSAAADVFRLSLTVERQAPWTALDARTPDAGGLSDLERATAAATRAADLLDERAGAPLAPRSAEAAPGILRADGTVDPAVLCPVPFAPAARLRCDAVADLVRLNEVFRAEHGTDLPVGDTYRTYEQQVTLKAAKGGLAATPGESHHGWGVAVDFRGFGGVGEFDRPLYRWMVVHAPEFGWVHPAGMGPDGAGPHEPWHWEYAGTA